MSMENVRACECYVEEMRQDTVKKRNNKKRFFDDYDDDY